MSSWEHSYFPSGIQQTCIGKEHFLVITQFILQMDCNNRGVKTKTKGIAQWECFFTWRTQYVFSPVPAEAACCMSRVSTACVCFVCVSLCMHVTPKANSRVSIYSDLFSLLHVDYVAVCFPAVYQALADAQAFINMTTFSLRPIWLEV